MTVRLNELLYDLQLFCEAFLSTSSYRASMNPLPPLKNLNILWSKCATATPKNKYLKILNCNRPPPSLEFPDGCRRGWGWGEGECGNF